MSNYKTDQCRILHRGMEFHFVSYEGHIANPTRGETAAPAMWFLMRAGRRHAVMPHVVGQEDPVRDRQLADWLDANAFVPMAAPVPAPPRRGR
ncbi:MAG: hypothetical protein HOP28_14770 [Gemmatimonadales bacterium]|nr:hypothetical protein [Gemmatimonadales bacterium]